MKKIVLSLAILSCAACSKTPVGAQAELFTFGEPLAEAKSKNLDEASGLAASINFPDHLWTLNDSGNGAEIYLIDKNADIKLVCRLKGIKNRDWEDIAVGPGPKPGKSFIYVADIGDNTAQYPVKYVYRFEEPNSNSGTGEIEITAIDQITFRLPERQKDTECLLLDPKTKDLYVVSKRESPVFLYQLKYPYSITDTLTAIQATSIPISNVSAGSISSDGKEVLLKNYNHIFYWKIGKKGLAETLKKVPTRLPYKPEPQGEAIAWANNGDGFFTISETVIGKRSYLFFYRRK